MEEIPRLTGKEFEERLLFRAAKYKERRDLKMNRYGVQANMIGGKWTPVESYPDFEGLFPGGRHFVMEAKVTSGASFQAAQTANYKERQHSFMLEESSFGAICCLAIHWNERKLKTKHEPAATYLFPVRGDMEVWQRFDRGELKQLTRQDCSDWGYPVEWNLWSPRARNPSPDFLPALLEMRSTT